MARIPSWTASLTAAMLLGSGAASAAPPALAEGDQPCAACHEQVIDAKSFAVSVHAPLGCAACHSSIDLAKHPGDVAANRAAQKVPAAASQVCMGCHEASVPTHQKWLPNATTHLAVVSCAACHAPGAKRHADLRLFDIAANRELALAQDPDALVAKTGKKDVPLDIEHIDRLVESVSGPAHRVMLVGRLDTDPTDSHRFAPKAGAVKECATCHRKGSDAFQQVSLSLVGPEGTRTRYEARPEVLHAPTSIDTVRGFYALGGTRIGALDILLGLAVLGGVSAPIGHAVMRRLSRRKERHE